jgi:hypothetical protein
MRTSITRVNVDETHTRYRKVIEGNPCAQGSLESRQQQLFLLQSLSGQPELLNCGMDPFQKLTMYHNGDRWLVELEAVAVNPGA